MNRLFALADCNNFYASCEQLFQPELQGRPTVVLSNNDGCVIARSAEAKALGIPFGEPHFKMREKPKFRDVQVRSANFTLYGDMSRRVMETIAAHVPDMEIYSIDECFIDYTGAAVDVAAHAVALRATVRQWTGLNISIGLGPTKTLAKLANAKAKKNNCGVFDISDKAICNASLRETDIGDVWGIGRRWSKRLALHRIHTAHDLSRMDRRQIRNMMGVVGLRTVDELNGISCVDLELSQPDKQALCISRSFGQTVHSRDGLVERVHYFTCMAAEKLRAGGLVAGALSVFVRGNPFRPELPQYSNSITLALPFASSDTKDLLAVALQGLKAIYKPGIPYKKAGVLLLDLHRKERAPRNLFGTPDPRQEKLMQTMDGLNRKFGPGAVCYGQKPQPRTWYMNQQSRSKRFTTHWDELLTAR